VAGRSAGNPFRAVEIHPFAGARIDFPQHTVPVLNGKLTDLILVLGAADRFAALDARLQFTESGFSFFKVHQCTP
jgi:hypothetical protein